MAKKHLNDTIDSTTIVRHSMYMEVNIAKGR